MPFTGNAQEKPYTIKGQVTDNETGRPMGYGTVAIYRQSDSSMVTGSMTEDNGKFKFRVKAGSYYAEIRHLSFQTEHVGDVEVGPQNSTEDLGRIALRPTSKFMNEVEVKGEQNPVQLDLDKRVVNVDQDLTNVGSDATELLNDVPSVDVDADGNISLRGSGNVRILINGKPSGLLGISGSDALRQLQASMIERIEVITNPSARYDAEGQAGIINIILKKDKRLGINGTITAQTGYPHNHNAGLNLNYKRNWYNIFTSYNARYRKAPGGGSNLMDYDDGDTAYLFESERNHERGGWNHNARLGSDFYLDSNTTVTVSGLYRYGDETNLTNIVYRDLDPDGNLLRRSEREQEEEETDETMEGNASFEKEFAEENHKLTADFQWTRSNETELGDIREEVEVGNGATVEQFVTNKENEEKQLYQVDYIRPFLGKGKFETGTRINVRSLENIYTVEEKDENGEWQVRQDFDDKFYYDEAVYAGYAMLSHEVGVFSWQAGLRAEYTDVEAEMEAGEANSDQEYLNFFPTLHTSYKLDKQNTFQLSYSRRLSRPHFRSLLPFSNLDDARNLYQGNPNLQPEYTNSFEAGYLRYFDKGSFMPTVYYRHRTGVIDRITTTSTPELARMIPVNLAQEDAIGFEFNGNYNLFEWWQIRGSFNFYNSNIEGSYEGETLDRETTTWTTRLTSKLSPWDAFDFQASLRYRAPRETTQGEREGIYNIDLSLSKSIWDDNARVNLNVRDLLNSRIYRGTTYGENFYRESEFQWRRRQVTLSFTYYLNKDMREDRGRRGDGGPGGGR